jgi:HEAT repeat protein
LLGDPNDDVRWSAAVALGKIAEGIKTNRQIEIAKKLKKKYNQLKAKGNKHSCAKAISSLKEAMKRRFLDVFGPNFGWKV